MNKSQKTLRKNALNIFKKGIDAADPYQAVLNCLQVAENHFEISLDLSKPDRTRTGRWANIHLLAVGKAACNMIEAQQAVIPAHRLASTPIAVTNYENKKPLKDVEILTARHPVPDASGIEASARIINNLKQTEQGDLVLVLISGGGSALLPSPAAGISLEDKQITTDLLLSCGASINQINCVRKHLSNIKGGYLAKHAMPADLHTLMLSDVLGDDLSAIASGPTVADDSTFQQAVNILKEYQIWDKIPANVHNRLENGCQGNIPETPKANDSCFKNANQTLIGSNTLSLSAIAEAANNLSYTVDIYSQNLSGEAREIAEQLVIYAQQKITDGLDTATAILAGGESTVTIQGKGKGGRNQEMALAFALAAEKHALKAKWAFLSGGTDGLDGPTDAAGGIVDPGTLKRIKEAKANPLNRLKNNDSYAALKKSDDLVITGATGTNVADLQILLIQPE